MLFSSMDSSWTRDRLRTSASFRAKSRSVLSMISHREYGLVMTSTTCLPIGVYLMDGENECWSNSLQSSRKMNCRGEQSVREDFTEARYEAGFSAGAFDTSLGGRVRERMTALGSMAYAPVQAADHAGSFRPANERWSAGSTVARYHCRGTVAGSRQGLHSH